MQLKSETRDIGGHKLVVTQLATGEGLRLFFKLAKLVGPSVGTLIREWQGKSIQRETVGKALTELINKLEWGEFNDFVQTFARNTKLIVAHVNEKTGDSEERRVSLEQTIGNVAFAGDYLALVQWLGFCLELNFASFFAGLGLTSPQSSAEAE